MSALLLTLAGSNANLVPALPLIAFCFLVGAVWFAVEMTGARR